MGDIANMMLDGTMCVQCGEWINDGETGPGYPIMCESCAANAPPDDDEPAPKPKKKKGAA